MSQLSIMVDTSSDSSSRPTHIHSYSSPQDNSSAPSSASLHSPMTPGGSHLPFPGPTSRPSSGVGAPHGHPYSLPPAPSPRIAPYNQTQFYGMPSPQGIQLPSYQDLAHPHGSYIGSPDAMANQVSMGPQGQKRAYRQRRKDPSCDACRERKVKCDATDTSSCTECTSRSVRCQFTKDTNRRMTSLKHNQDLIKELARTKSELELARIEAENGRPLPSSRNASAAHLPGPDHPDVPGHDRSPLPGPESAYLPQDPKPRIREQHASPDQPPTKKRRLANDQDLSKISMNMQRYGRGIFQATHSHRLTHPPVSISSDVPALPGKETADVLLRHYHSIIHPIIPVLYWHEFHKQYDRVYEEGSLQNVPRIWVGLLFAIFAIGTLQLDWKEGQKYLEISKSQIDIFTEDPTLDHARVALLASIFLVETNSKSAGWTWLGVATRIALDLGLHCEIGAGSAIEQEMRRRIWWCIYSCDCLLCLEMGRPSMVREEDCNVRMPSPMDDQHILPGSDWTAPTPAQSTSLLPSMLQAIGGITRLLRILRVPRLTSHTLQAYESHFTKCIDDFLVQRQVHLHDYVDPLDLPPIMYLQNARLMLHRNNLNPQCPASARSQAIDSCASMAKSTANLLRRCMQVPPTESHSPGTMTAPQSSTTWETRLLSTASAFLCTHIWRCTLFLCFRLDFHDALSCARASAVLGNARPVNVACGKYLEFYLRELTARLDQGHSSGFDTDEEMMAYVSGDLQGCYGSSWVWQGQDSAVVGGGGGNVPSEDHHGLKGSLQNTNGITTNEDAEEEDSKWDAWHTVLQTMERLALTQAQTQAQAPPEAQLKAKEQDPSPPPQSTSSSSSTPPAPQSQRPPPPRTRRISPPGSDPDQLRSMARSPEAQAAVRERMRIRDLI